MTKHHAIEIVSASILAGILSISAVRLEAVPRGAKRHAVFALCAGRLLQSTRLSARLPLCL